MPRVRVEYFSNLLKTALEQKRLDKAASSTNVRWLLNAAKGGGMSQHQFELAAGELQAGGGRGVGFNGRLWHHYMSTDARMSLFTFDLYLTYFFSKSWINELQHREARHFIESSLGIVNFLAGENRGIREIVKNNPGLMSLDEYIFVLGDRPSYA